MHPTSVESAFASIVSELGEVNVLLYNAGSGVFGDKKVQRREMSH